MNSGVNQFNPMDRWGNTPLDDAIRGHFQDVIDILQEKGAIIGKETNQPHYQIKEHKKTEK